MKKIMENKEMDVFEAKASKQDIERIILIEHAKIRNKKTKKEYFNSRFLKIINRKRDIRILDLDAGSDITNMLNELELVYDKNTRETDIFLSFTLEYEAL